ncbi:MAG: hypothetical protein JST52_11940 [Bacteroidetes bacterium]|nr:hypothetical protein [Bacteroidota bacterium]MBS1740905.1 hypothetical protein [Bacteroidota bacterium]
MISNQGTKQVMDVVHTTPNNPFFTPTPPTLAAASLDYTEYDVTGGSTSNSLTLEKTNYALGRIESMSQNNVTLSPNAAQWQVCAIVNDPMMTAMGIGHVPKGYNQDATGNLNTFYLHFPSDSMDHQHPAVSAGTGVNSFDPYTGMLNIGNQYYMCGYYPVGDDPNFYYTRDVDATTGSLATNNYYQINQNPLAIGLPNKALALSSSSNTGYCLLSAWSDGSDPVNIYYKLSPNGGVKYRPTPATTTQQIQHITLFSNPAEAVLTLNGVAQTGEYTIYLT